MLPRLWLPGRRRAHRGTRIIAAPCGHAPTPAVASEPSSRSSGRHGAVAGPRGEPVGGPEQPPEGSPCGWCRRHRASPSATSSSRWRSRVRLCSAVLPKPMPGSIQISVTPAGSAAAGPLGEEGRDLGDHVVVARGRPAWSAGVPCMCIATQPTPSSAATGQSEAETSLISVAPAATAARATAGLPVSIETRTSAGERLDDRDAPGAAPRPRSPASAPGRVDSPPTSIDGRRPRRSAASPWATAASGRGSARRRRTNRA